MYTENMIYLMMILVAFTHVYFMIRIGFQSKFKDKKRIEKLMHNIMYSSLLASVITAFLWFIAPVTFVQTSMVIVKIIIIFLPAFYFIGAIGVFIGVFSRKLIS